MINQEDREVFLRKAIHSNGVRLKVLEELARDGLFPVEEKVWKAELRRLRLRIFALNTKRLYPPVYLRTVKFRGYGQVAPGYVPSREELAYLERVRAEFGPALNGASSAALNGHAHNGVVRAG